MGYPERIQGGAGTYERWAPDRHTEALVDMAADAEVMRFLGGEQPRTSSEELSQVLADHWNTHGFGLWACLDEDGRCQGFTGATHPSPVWVDFDGEVELGWRLKRTAWGRGLAAEGARLALDAVTDHLQPDRVIAFVDPANRRSQAVAERLGLSRRAGAHDRRLGTDIDVLALDLARAETA